MNPLEIDFDWDYIPLDFHLHHVFDDEFGWLAFSWFIPDLHLGDE